MISRFKVAPVRIRGLVLLLLAAALPACNHDDDDDDAVPAGPPPPALAAPNDVRATPGNTMVMLTSTAVPGATGYTIRSATNQGGFPAGTYGLVEANFQGTTFIDDMLINGETYFYVVSTMNGSIEGGPSTEVSATPRP